MTTLTLSISTTAGIALGDFEITYNPIVIAAGVSISNSGGSYAVTAFLPFTINNYGVVSGYRSGVYLSDGGSVINESSASISGNLTGIEILGVAGIVINDGSITTTAGGGGGGIGVYLSPGGSVTNAASASITSDSGEGVLIRSGVGTVVNDGRITATYTHMAGVDLQSGGSVINAASASITGGYMGWGIYDRSSGIVVNAGNILTTGTGGRGIRLGSGSVTNTTSASITGGGDGVYIGTGVVVNAGTIAGTNANGIFLVGGGSVTNAASASITGGVAAIKIYGAPGMGTVVNDGIITGTGSNSYGVFLDGGSVTNAASASITGNHIGVDLAGGGTLTNAGTIIGSSGTAVAFGGTGSSLLALNPGFKFSGVVSGSATARNILELTSAVSAGTLHGLGSQYLNFTQTTIDGGAAWTLTGANTVAAGETMANSGSLKLFGASLIVAGTLENDGTISADPSSVTAASIGGIGTIEIGANSTVTASGTVSAGQTIAFTGTNGVLNIQHSGEFAGAIMGQGPTDKVNIACFATGTRILTIAGELPVEHLRVGDRIVTLHGLRLAPIVWIGHRHLDCMRHPRPYDVRPICIKAGAIADGVPHRDLWLSPEHAVLVRAGAEAALVPIRHLLNGTTIAQMLCASVTYWHVQLASHDAIVAEGLAAETYLDTGNRADFDNGGPVVSVHPAFADAVWRATACAPQLRFGDALGALQYRLAIRAARSTGVQHVQSQTDSFSKG
jgi:hypothetical protein